MARSQTSRRQETLFTPFIDETEGHLFAVKVRTGPGQLDWLTDPLPKRLAARRMREIRQEMCRAYLAARS
jgi:hypothetical protein